MKQRRIKRQDNGGDNLPIVSSCFDFGKQSIAGLHNSPFGGRR
jgi:hypothetical protein